MRHMMGTRTAKRMGAVLVAAGLAAGVGACSDDDEEAATTDTASETTTTSGTGDGAGEDLVAACETNTEVSQAFGAVFESEDPEAAVEAYQRDVEPLLAELQEQAPTELQDALERGVALLDRFVEEGDFAVLEDPEFSEIGSEIDGYFFEHCEGPKLEVTAVEYAFEGVADTEPAGVTYISFTNRGEELHELAIARRADGETRSVEEILALGEEGGEDLLEFVGGTFAQQGQTTFTSLQLEPGDYAFICFVPVGSVDPEAEGNDDAPPHFTQGMIRAFTVE